MISPPSPTFSHSHARPRSKDENLPQAQHDEDPISQLGLKRRQPRRAPLDPLSVSHLENRCNRLPQSTDSASYHSFVTPSSVPELPDLLPKETVGSGYGGVQRHGTCSAPVSAWPPPILVSGPGKASNTGLTGQQPSQCIPPHSSDKATSVSRAIFLESTSTWHAPEYFQTEPTATMTKPMRTTGWKSETALQPIRSRTSSVPTVRRPPGELWRSDAGPTTKAIHEPINPADSSVPPGLFPRRPELKRSGPIPDPLSHNSISSSLAFGSQPLTASEPTKTVPPIGAERSWVMSPLKSHASATQSSGPCQTPWNSSRLQAKWKHDACLLDATSLKNVQMATGTSKEDLERLLRHAVRNKYAPKIISPLSPLRTSTAAFDLSTDPEYQLRMPSQSNNPSPRYSKCLASRVRTVCDGHQSFDLDTTCMHCQECKRDTIGKRLLALRYHQHQTHHVQRNKVLLYHSVSDDRIALANRIREVFAYEIDDEEKSLWEEVAAATGAGPQPFSRMSAPCAVSTYRRAVEDGSEDGTHVDYLESSDDGLLANESAILFRDVAVY